MIGRRPAGTGATLAMKTTDKAGGDRRIAVGLVLIGITSVQFGSALATKGFDDVGPGGTVFLRTLFAADRPGRRLEAGARLDQPGDRARHRPLRRDPRRA